MFPELNWNKNIAKNERIMSAAVCTIESMCKYHSVFTNDAIGSFLSCIICFILKGHYQNCRSYARNRKQFSAAPVLSESDKTHGLV